MESSEALTVTEQYLQEMLKADDTADFELYTRRFESEFIENFTQETFANDIQSMHERNGMNQGYEFLAELRTKDFKGRKIFKTVWKGIYEKRDAIIEFAIYQKDGQWYVIQSAVY